MEKQSEWGSFFGVDAAPSQTLASLARTFAAVVFFSLSSRDEKKGGKKRLRSFLPDTPTMLMLHGKLTAAPTPPLPPPVASTWPSLEIRLALKLCALLKAKQALEAAEVEQTPRARRRCRQPGPGAAGSTAHERARENFFFFFFKERERERVKITQKKKINIVLTNTLARSSAQSISLSPWGGG